MKILLLFSLFCFIWAKQSSPSESMVLMSKRSEKLRKLEGMIKAEPIARKFSGNYLMHYIGPEAKAVLLGKRHGFLFKKKILKDYYLFNSTMFSSCTIEEIKSVSDTMTQEDKKMLDFKKEELTQIQWFPEIKSMELSTSGPTLIRRKERSIDNISITDPFWDKQWHLHADQTPSMKVIEAWNMGYNGKGVVVGIIGDGIDVNHEDLIVNFNASLSYDFIDDVHFNGFIGQDDYGTRAFGIVAASKNNHCIVGIAFEASIAAFRAQHAELGVTSSSFALAWTYNLDAIDIFNNGFSIGVDHGGGFYEMDEVAKSALIQGINEGRKGKGTIFVFAAGQDGEYFDDCNTVELANNMYTIGVNPLGPDGSPATYSEECTNIMTAAYAGEDYQNGTKMYLATTSVNNSCVENFGGSGASVSVVSGIVALTLQANPELTWRDMQHLIAETSTSTGIPRGNFYQNAAGKNVSYGLGFGMINAEAMVQTASTWKRVPERISCSSGTLQVDECCSRSVAASYNVDDCPIRYLEHVQVFVSCKVYWREHTEIHLVSPLGTDSRILRQRKQDYETIRFGWTFMSVHTWGENPTGNWTVRLDDFLDCDNDMYLYSWTLTLHGTVTNPLDGIPENGTLGGYCDNDIPCTGGTTCLQDSSICVDCSIAAHRVVNDFCVKDGYGYCSDNITCKEENAWCNADNVCETCGSDYHEIDGQCIKDGTLGGYCDALAVCVDSAVACDAATERCVNCSNGYRIFDYSCIEDRILYGYCDQDNPCITTEISTASCDPGTNRCLNCIYADNHRILNGFCIEDGIIGGFCGSETPCTVTGSGCDPENNTCISCSDDGYRTLSNYCKRDGEIGGYCDTDVECSNGTGCDSQSNTCINCSETGYRVLPGGNCKQDGMIDGYCNSEILCTTFAAGCVPGFNICAICYAGHTLIDGYCIEDEIPELLNVDTESNVGTIIGTVVAGFIIGVAINCVIFVIVLQKSL